MGENLREYAGNHGLQIVAVAAAALVAAGVSSSVIATRQNNPEHGASIATVVEGIAGGGLAGSLAYNGILLAGTALGRRQEHENQLAGPDRPES